MTQPWIKDAPQLLVIGHDPRLNNSNTIASYSLFADYYFKEQPKSVSEQKKFNLASSLFNLINHLTSGLIKAECVGVTNLCNESLPHAPKNKTVFIPENIAHKGIQEITILPQKYPSIKLILAMSLQTSFWLQKLGFCSSDLEFIKAATPKFQRIHDSHPYYEPSRAGAFQLICGKIFVTSSFSPVPVVPILHIKNFPLKRNFIVYEKYMNLAQKNISESLRAINSLNKVEVINE